MEELDLKELINMFWTRKVQILIIVVIFLIIGLVYSYLFVSPEYKATTTVILAQASSTTEDGSQTITSNDLTLNQKLVSTYSALIKSDNILSEVIRNLNIDKTEASLKNNITVSSVEEMENYLDFDIPVLDKEVESYSVLVEDRYPTMGQINYTDGSEFRMQYGSGDISGIYGGTLEESRDVEGVKVEYYQYADTAYAVWEENGFAFSYVYAKDGSADVEHIIQQFR